jgi:hypothetical protein
MCQKERPFQLLIRLAGCSTIALASFIGCHSAFVETTIDNRGPSALRLIEVDYPNASFGVGSLSPYSQFHYRFKIQGSGPIKLEYTDSQGQTHSVNGPTLDQGQEGKLIIAIDPEGRVTWQPSLTKPQ